jgi:hypothetical protein
MTTHHYRFYLILHWQCICIVILMNSHHFNFNSILFISYFFYPFLFSISSRSIFFYLCLKLLSFIIVSLFIVSYLLQIYLFFFTYFSIFCFFNPLNLSALYFIYHHCLYSSNFIFHFLIFCHKFCLHLVYCFVKYLNFTFF